MVNTTLGPLPESTLVKREDVVDNDNERTTSIEYCLIGCKGLAHVTRTPDSQSYFCNQHVHRSVHVIVKKIEAALGMVAQLG